MYGSNELQLAGWVEVQLGQRGLERTCGLDCAFGTGRRLWGCELLSWTERVENGPWVVPESKCSLVDIVFLSRLPTTSLSCNSLSMLFMIFVLLKELLLKLMLDLGIK